MIIIIGGFTASGKSYLAECLSKKLNYKFIHTSHILKQITEKNKININNTKMNKGWYEFSNLDDIRKKQNEIDIKLDKYLLNIINKKKNIILDTWALPYLSNKGIRIWLNASTCERAKRMSIRDKISFNKAIKLINKKDKFNIKHFKKIYNFTLGKDLDVYDYIINTEGSSIKEVCNKVYKIIKKIK